MNNTSIKISTRKIIGIIAAMLIFAGAGVYFLNQQLSFPSQKVVCAVAGCSGELCVSADKAGDIFTACIYRPEYACYKEALCEPQADGKCGWTQTAELRACLANPPQSSGIELMLVPFAVTHD